MGQWVNRLILGKEAGFKCLCGPNPDLSDSGASCYIPPLPRPLSQLALPQVLGLILNLPSPVSLGLLSLPLRRRHWVALRQVDGIYYNLDSKLRAPEALGDEDGVR